MNILSISIPSCWLQKGGTIRHLHYCWLILKTIQPSCLMICQAVKKTMPEVMKSLRKSVYEQKKGLLLFFPIAPSFYKPFDILLTLFGVFNTCNFHCSTGFTFTFQQFVDPRNFSTLMEQQTSMDFWFREETCKVTFAFLSLSIFGTFHIHCCSQLFNYCLI